MTILIITVIALLVIARKADAHIVYKPRNDTLTERLRVQTLNFRHARYVCRHGGGQHKRWSCKAKVWLRDEMEDTWALLHPPNPDPAPEASARARAIAAAEIIRSRGGNPWPVCPDPNDGASWDATKACESPGYGWHQDPPGYYCGPLQFDPHIWADLIRRYGIPCS